MEKLTIWLGVVAGLFLTGSVILFGWFEDGYSHLDNSVSALGALSANNTILFNIFGLIVPGTLLSFSFITQYKLVAKDLKQKFIYASMVIFGVMFAGLASPMDRGVMPYFGVTIHYILAYASVVPFLSASILTALTSKGVGLNGASLIVLPILFALTHLSHHIGVPSGLVQRGLLGCIFLWVALVCIQNVTKLPN